MRVNLAVVADFRGGRVQTAREKRKNPVGFGNIRKHDVGLGKALEMRLPAWSDYARTPGVVRFWWLELPACDEKNRECLVASKRTSHAAHDADDSAEHFDLDVISQTDQALRIGGAGADEECPILERARSAEALSIS
jgi:hypothetical protein